MRRLLSALPLLMLPLLLPADLPAPSPTAPVAAPTPVALTAEQRGACERLGLDPARIAELAAKPLFQFKEADVDAYLRYLHAVEPSIPARVLHLGRKNIGQPYELYLLGEFPYEMIDPQPTYCLDRSDCVVFAEHTYAMALGSDWGQFYGLLQRIRYRHGEVGVATRNHYTEADWNTSNQWLVHDVSAEVSGGKAVSFTQKLDRAKFLRNRYKIERDIPVQEWKDVYVPLEALPEALPKLRDGDFVNVMVGQGSGVWATHVGLIAHGPDGVVHLLHSTPPQVREEPLMDYANRKGAADPKKPQLKGFKFLRLQPDPIGNLKMIDGIGWPSVKFPPANPAAAGKPGSASPG